MKKCPTCKETKPYSDFSKNKGKKDGFSCHCRGCKKEYQARWYRKNSTRHKANTRRRTSMYENEIRTLFDSCKAKSGCADCGEKNPIVLDFDHVNGIKEFNLSWGLQKKFPMHRILAEIKKCEVRCANCHRIATHNRLDLLATNVRSKKYKLAVN